MGNPKTTLLRRIIDWAAAYWHGVCWFLAGIAFLAAFIENPDGEFTGTFAAVIVMCVAAAALVEIVRGPDRVRKWPAVLGGVATLAAAYLFVASEAEAHPGDIHLIQALGIVWLLAAFVIMFLALLFVLMRWSDRGVDRQATTVEDSDVDT